MGEGHREAGIVTERSAVLEKPGQKSEQHKGRGGTQRSGDLKKTKAILEKPGQKNKSTQGVWRDPEKQGS